MGNFVLPKKNTTPLAQLFAKYTVIHGHSRRAVEYYANLWVRTRPRKTPPFLPPRGRSLFLLKKRLAGAEQLKGT
jgi:hypothetical protein